MTSTSLFKTRDPVNAVQDQNTRVLRTGDDVVYSTEHRDAGWFDYHATILDWYWQEATNRTIVLIHRSWNNDVIPVPATRVTPLGEFVDTYGMERIL